jgi:hypothetical protein
MPVLAMNTLVKIFFFVPIIAQGQSGQIDKSEERRERRFFVPDQKIASQKSDIQIQENGDTVLVSYFEDINSANLGRVAVSKVYKGTPFLNNGWYIGNLHYKGYNSTRGTMAYNLHSGLLYFAITDKEPAIEAQPNAFDMQNMHFERLDKQYKNAGKAYYQPIKTKENLSIFKRYQCELRPKLQVQATGYDQIKLDAYEGEFIKSATYWWASGNKLILINGHKKNLNKLQKIAPTVAQILKQQTLKLNDQSGVEQLLRQLY